MVATLVALHLGLALIGRTPAEVTARLGTPQRVGRYPMRRDFRYRRFEVIFGDGHHASAFLATPTPRPAAVRSTLAALGTLRETRGIAATRRAASASSCFRIGIAASFMD